MLTDGFRLAELASGDETKRARQALATTLLDAIESSDPENRAEWLAKTARALRTRPSTTDPRVAAIVGGSSAFVPRRQYRPPPGLRQHLTRWLRTQSTSVRAAREIAELEDRWDE